MKKLKHSAIRLRFVPQKYIENPAAYDGDKDACRTICIETARACTRDILGKDFKGALFEDFSRDPSLPVLPSRPFYAPRILSYEGGLEVRFYDLMHPGDQPIIPSMSVFYRAPDDRKVAQTIRDIMLRGTLLGNDPVEAFGYSEGKIVDQGLEFLAMYLNPGTKIHSYDGQLREHFLVKPKES